MKGRGNAGCDIALSREARTSRWSKFDRERDAAIKFEFSSPIWGIPSLETCDMGLLTDWALESCFMPHDWNSIIQRSGERSWSNVIYRIRLDPVNLGTGLGSVCVVIQGVFCVNTWATTSRVRSFIRGQIAM